MKWAGLPLLIFGSGGVSKEMYQLIEQINNYNNVKIYDFLGFVENDEDKIDSEVIDGYRVVTSDSKVYEYSKKIPLLGVVIPIGTPKIKEIIYNKIKSIDNIVYPNIIHPKVIIDQKTVSIGIGNIITSGVNLTCCIEIGDFNLINWNTTIGHDTKIGNYNVINPLVSVSGNVSMSNLCLIGTGANILQGLTIHERVTVGAGAVVTKNVDQGTTVVGVPAKKINS